MRTRIGPGASAASASPAASSAPTAIGKATKNASPCVSTSTAERFAQDAAMFGKCMRIVLDAELVQQLRRALHVGEEEGHGSRGEIAPHGCMIHHANLAHIVRVRR